MIDRPEIDPNNPVKSLAIIHTWMAATADTLNYTLQEIEKRIQEIEQRIAKLEGRNG